MRRRRRNLALSAAVALAALLSLGLEDAFSHTDDGCQVERHCLACRSLQGPAAPPVTPVQPAVRLEQLGRVAVEHASVRAVESGRRGDSRAPPLA